MARRDIDRLFDRIAFNTRFQIGKGIWTIGKISINLLYNFNGPLPKECKIEADAFFDENGKPYRSFEEFMRDKLFI